MRFVLHYLNKYKIRCLWYLVLVAFSVVFVMATALSVADFLKILFGDDREGVAFSVTTGNLIAIWLEELYALFIQFGQLKALLLFSSFIFILYALKNIFTYFSAIQVAYLRTHVVRDIRNDLISKVMHVKKSYYDRNRKGDILSRFSSDIIELDEGLIASLQMLVSSLLSMLLYLLMLFYINVKLSVFVLCMLPLIAGVVAGLSRRLKRQSKEVQNMNGMLISTTEETIAGNKIIKAYTAKNFVNERFQASNYAFTHRRIAMYRRVYAASPISDFLGNCIVVSILLYGAHLIIGGDNGLTPELFVSYVMLFVLMIPPAKEFSTAISQIRKGHACADRIESLLNEEEEDYSEEGTQDKAASKKCDEVLAIEHIDFSYDGTIKVLQNVCFSIPKGKTYAIVGNSGSGKSTIVDLICRFYAPSKGTIRLLGEDIWEMTLQDLRQRISVVSQDMQLFNDSVRNNIAFGKEGATDDEVRRAAIAAQADTFINDLPQGYNTNIGEGGGNLSGGQRQRLCIARALIYHPDLLILDEATSALDTEVESLLQQTLNEVLRNNTALVIAHRLSTVRNADKIIVLDGGKIIEEGTHKELLAKGGKYAELVALQSLV